MGDAGALSAAPDGRLFDLAATATAAEPVEAAPTPPVVEPAVAATAPEQPNLITFLRAILAHLYTNEADARRVVADAGLAADRITFSGHATNTWHAILTEAEKSGQIDAVLAVALKEYGSNQTLQAVAAMYRGGVSGAVSIGSAAAAGHQHSVGGSRGAGAEPVEAPITFDWVTIPAGKFWMGSDKAKDKLAYDDEQPCHEVDLPTFRMARYPVTAAQFEQFVNATGYRTTAEKEGSAKVWTGFEWKEAAGADWAQPCPCDTVKKLAPSPVSRGMTPMNFAAGRQAYCERLVKSSKCVYPAKRSGKRRCAGRMAESIRGAMKRRIKNIAISIGM